ncbi:MAG: hypothetical protein GC131_08850 [Alphaproteobacteria bacterium]|nr:hypothetical protein [Alphaproteobacteria bacterium]
MPDSFLSLLASPHISYIAAAYGAWLLGVCGLVFCALTERRKNLARLRAAASGRGAYIDKVA